MQGHFQADAAGLGKRARTRAALLDGALSVIAEKGVENTKINDITDTAGLANGTFYNHFHDKDEILREVAYGIAGEVGRQIDEEMVAIKDARARVVTATTRFISLALADLEWGSVLIGSVEHMPEVRKDIMQYLQADLALGVEQGVFDIDLNQFLLDQIAALVVVSIRTQMDENADENMTAATCENILRLCGQSPTAARKAVAKLSKAAS